ncbi:MAG: anhydro-N-acetylmuramic acid kinase [Kosmotogaceae bacterium]
MNRIIGLMSGTSCDGLDICCCDIQGSFTQTKLEIKAFESFSYDSRLREQLRKLTSGNVNVSKIARANVYLAKVFASYFNSFISKNELGKTIDLIVSHGQTIFHDTNKKNDEFYPSCTLQIGDGDYVSYLTGVPVLSDVRMKDMAAGGQGAPMVVYADYVLFNSKEENVGLQNIGGIGNVTLMKANSSIDEVISFDTGPGNVLIDMACNEFFGKSYDDNGNIANSGSLNTKLMEYLWDLERDYFEMPPPKSTGKEIRYNESYFKKIKKFVQRKSINKNDVVATITRFASETIVGSYKKIGEIPDIVYVSGGGAKNKTLLSMIESQLKVTKVETMSPLWQDAKEAAAFAIIGNEYLNGHFSNVKSATGAEKKVILGKYSLPI